jgi:outer membrane protein OmpA-like peptidoglycan-associated protein
MVAALGLSASACAHVTPEQLDTQLATLRDDMNQKIEQGDQQTASQLGGRLDDVESRVSRLQSDLNDLSQKFDVTVQKLETALQFDMPVYFEFDQADLLPKGRDVLQRFSQVAQEYYPGALVTVEGFTDSSGSQEYNQRLGMRRADAVKAFLVEQGMSGENIRTVSYGESSQRIVADGQHGPGTSGWENRRVVIVIDHASQSSAATSDR